MLLQNRQTPLHKAAGHGYKEIVVQLLGAAAAVDAADKVTPPPQLGCIAIKKVDGRKSTRGLRAVVAKDSGERGPKSSPSLAI
jgi:ankyrin repeat protein